MVGAVVLAVGASGCTGGPGPTGSPPTSGGATASPVVSVSSSPTATVSATPTPDPRPTAGSAKGPARNLPKPTMPAAAKQKTEAGLKAYAAYWVAALSYGFEATDTSLVRKASAPGCVDCVSLYDSIDRKVPKGGWGAGGKLTPEFQLRDGFVPDVNGQYIVLNALSQAQYNVFTSNGRSAGNNIGRTKVVFLLALEFLNGEWKLVNYDPLKT
ncbi:DUF6318 family protein [Tersicoccus sp. Bi-70]|uniref:DUF6318 family protein n=1 Tax=Tersicoccus sp. Bi-70 TaxID=1897634 RepID=UPI00117BF338|nr:DUF6318 family protein [Tersicoccus sp. Bi-70]